MKVAVVGAAGRMGQSVCEAIEAAKDLELVARLDEGDAISSDTLASAEVAVEFTVPSATDANVHAILDAGAHAVVGTTGWSDERLEKVAEHANQAGKNVVIAPNYALSAVLAMSFAEKAAAMFESVEVIELHHPDKVDAPSGTATTTARRIGEVRAEAGLSSPDATQTDPHGSRGAVIDGVNVHAVRLRGLYAHEEILFGNPGEQLTIRQDSFGRDSFMPGVLLAVRKVGSRPGLTYGLEPLLDM
ncbi:4-hydroxy-tetrahydrodipicolinate reductase [Trueperella bonasi]|uniref:4-hydroxy-tetrahydrodipicolinate reductase n=1 Tax=Trueperella bonasi TaxID=312286 RepID=A0ABT9NHU7_9ACTO|nr:4-hydroxy-tetrahydrodipicolinate reductase [Trueperella bonasi]MDP9806976.1 4-hydroxy-tetrahydrodipicolinate reductase [Trueperella bonasi]